MTHLAENDRLKTPSGTDEASAAEAGNASVFKGADAQASPIPSTKTLLQRSGFDDLRWALVTALAVAIIALLPLIWRPRYYFRGDTEIGAVGQWFHYGRSLLAGEWNMLDPQAWAGGNYIAEGQGGLFSPLTMAIALLVATVTSLVTLVTALKIGFLVVAGVGTFLLIRSYGVSSPFACVGGVSVVCGGVTQYLESPSWVTGTMVSALLPLAWWATRRVMRPDANPFWAFLVNYLVISVGYVYGTIFLALAILACLVDAVLAGNRRGALRILLVGISSGLVAVTVYLPGILSASVTTRAGFVITSTGKFQADVFGLLTSTSPTGLSPSYDAYPLHYIAWFLPMLFWLRIKRVRRVARPLAGMALVLVVGVVWALGPNQVGPIRWTLRAMPLVVLCAIVITVVLLARARPHRLGGRDLGLALSSTGVIGYLLIARFWNQGPMMAISTLTVMLAVAASWFLLRGSRSATGKRERTTALFMVTWTIVVVILQHAFFPNAPSVDRELPGDIGGYATQASTARGDTIVVGDTNEAVLSEPESTRDFVLASSWYLTERNVQSLYSTIGFSAYNDMYCIRFNGTSCRGLLTKLFTDEPTTEKPRADLLSVSTVHIYRDEISTSKLLKPPAGWSVSYESRWAVTWVRDKPLPPAGSVVWSTPGLDVEETASTKTGSTFSVRDVPAGGGQVVLSRLAWPGYIVTGPGGLAAPTDGYLLTVNVPKEADGEQITVAYEPPGWAIERAALVVGVGFVLIWSMAVLIRRRRDRNQSAPPSSASAAPDDVSDQGP